MNAPAERPGPGRIAWTFLRLGAFAFGGLGGALALLERELVERRGWVSRRDFGEALALTKPLPGSTMVQVAAYLGARLGGWPGALAAALAFVAPAACLMTAAAALTASLPDAPWARGALAGVQLAVAGLLASAMWRLARSEARGRRLTLVLLAACALGFFAPAALVVAGAGAAGVLAEGTRDA
ncbi:MAG: chromate transporter [Candidatus Tectomicrobia bacterium]|uniref:Chromate transporter n=1 Tax=Tectimicrobiota bacterium TaxID=2528274 RepID=A0A932MN85_UNCTE|nr:chromate transporter [Candidatus Tectomicrobia bacterium]